MHARAPTSSEARSVLHRRCCRSQVILPAQEIPVQIPGKTRMHGASRTAPDRGAQGKATGGADSIGTPRLLPKQESRRELGYACLVSHIEVS